MMPESPQLIEIGGWDMRMRIPPGDGPHPLIVLLHGWTGDENSMWIFASRLPEDVFLLAPRGLYPSAAGGFGWEKNEARGWPQLNDFTPAIEILLSALTPMNFPSANLARFSLVGFSQGAALAYSLALLHPERVSSLAALSGFMPEGAEYLISKRPLKGKPVFIAHGSQDTLVPVERAHQSVDLLKRAGAWVTYCEHNVGHKLSADCFRSMQAFYKNNCRNASPTS
jgi:phospholipase/carboxylesterase